MLQFVCDTCSTVKQPDATWIVGLAAEAVGAVSARRREVNIQSTWTREAAVHPLAVHFCSIECKDKYVARLFGTEPPEELVVERAIPVEVVIEKAVSEKGVAKRRKVGRHKRAS